MNTDKELMQQALEALETVLADAYHRRFPECCGRHGSECCGNPNEAWTPEDNKIMDALSPAQRQLSDALRAALAEQPAEQDPVTAWEDKYGMKEWEVLALRAGWAPALLNQESDPCPQCKKGGVCKTPKCGRLNLPEDHPCRSAPQPAKPAEQEPVAWQRIETAPKTGRKVILFYLNRNNFPRTVMARWLTDDEAAETDTDCVGLEGGWYECIDNWDDYTEVAIHEGEPTHWMPLPPAPTAEVKPDAA